MPDHRDSDLDALVRRLSRLDADEEPSGIEPSVFVAPWISAIELADSWASSADIGGVDRHYLTEVLRKVVQHAMKQTEWLGRLGVCFEDVPNGCSRFLTCARSPTASGMTSRSLSRSITPSASWTGRGSGQTACSFWGQAQKSNTTLLSSRVGSSSEDEDLMLLYMPALDGVEHVESPRAGLR